ncbi:uncharacterized protein LOC119666026 [Teleopsis dalmanni]|uniref:uncharacterized protein LOC119666026 n=1 Tax=Teleopsis dalmanni TaxID=139649 RepID=UPI0018CCE9B9|nr:uncharacterized protein LOC119666026 [Teleopsis dalmanni]
MPSLSAILDECRCPAAPDLGMGTQVPVVHTQIHRTPPRQVEHKRQFLSTLAPLTACVAGNKDDLTSYYTLATAHHSSHSTSHAHLVEYSSGLTGEQSNITLSGEDQRKVAPDVIAGTPGQEQQDELTAFAYQEVSRTEKLKKRYINDNLNVSSDDDEQNDYGFNKRPSVRGIKPKFNSTNEILQQMQEQLTQQMPNVNMQIPSAQTAQYKVSQQQHQQQQQQQEKNIQQQIEMHTNTITQQQAEHRTWSFYPESDDTKQQIPIETNLQQDFYQTLPAGTMFRQTMIQHDQDESLMYSQNSQTMTSIDPTHYGHLVRSPTRRPESPPPLRNYHQTMLLIPCNAETYSQLAPKNLDPKVAHIQRRNILEYQQCEKQLSGTKISNVKRHYKLVHKKNIGEKPSGSEEENCMIQLKQRHKAAYLKEEILKCLQKYNIDVDQIYCSTTDNGANMVKVSEILQDLQEEHINEEFNQEECSNETDDENIHAILATVLSVVRCAAHTIQLAAHDVLKSLELQISEYKDTVKQLRKAVRAGDINMQMPILDNTIRWNSTCEIALRIWRFLQRLVMLRDRAQLAATFEKLTKLEGLRKVGNEPDSPNISSDMTFEFPTISAAPYSKLQQRMTANITANTETNRTFKQKLIALTNQKGVPLHTGILSYWRTSNNYKEIKKVAAVALSVPATQSLTPKICA